MRCVQPPGLLLCGPLGAHPGVPAEATAAPAAPALRGGARCGPAPGFAAGSRRPFRPFRWKCPAAREWRPCSQPEERGRPALHGWEEGGVGLLCRSAQPHGDCWSGGAGEQRWERGLGRAGMGGRVWSRSVLFGACCLHAGALQRYWAVGADRVSLGLGVPGMASPGRSIRGQSCTVITLFVCRTGCMWHSSGAICLLSLLEDADLHCLSCRDDSPVLPDTIP